MASVGQLVPALMTAIGPAILVSAVGMLLLTLTNRLGRVIDRSRAIAGLVTSGSPHAPQTAKAQLDVMWIRARLIRLSIALACTSALCAVLLVTTLFLTTLFHAEIAWLIALLFIACLGTLVGSLVAFLRDVNLNLVALDLETSDARRPAPAESVRA